MRYSKIKCSAINFVDTEIWNVVDEEIGEWTEHIRENIFYHLVQITTPRMRYLNPQYSDELGSNLEFNPTFILEHNAREMLHHLKPRFGPMLRGGYRNLLAPRITRKK